MSTGAMTYGTKGRIVSDQDDELIDGMPPPNRMICACADLDFSKFKQTVGRLENQSFETLLQETGAGNTCTACLLDLEYYFVALKARGVGPASVSGDAAGAPSAERVPFKQRIYRLLDAMSPPLAWAPPNRVPLITGRGIETWLTITNHDLLFQERKSAPLATTVTVRRDDGHRLWRGRFEIDPGEELKIRLDQHLQASAGPLTVGSACVRSRARHPAMRGTMRPQLEILAPAGTCGLHAQGDVGPGETWFTVQNRPADQRLFLVLLNTAGKAQTARITSPFELYPTGVDADISVAVPLPSRGTGLHEITLPNDIASKIADRPFSVRTVTEAACRVFLVCATPALDRFSIDHR